MANVEGNVEGNVEVIEVTLKRRTYDIIISVLFLIVVTVYVGYYYHISAILEMLIRIPSMLNVPGPENKPYVSFSAATTPKVDAKYLATVTLTTVGYGDATPTSPKAQMMMCFLVVVAGGIMTRMLFYTFSMFVDRIILHYARRSFYLKKWFLDHGILAKILAVCFFMIVAPICIGAWVIIAHEKDMDHWFDAYYLSIISASTVGYGDKVFKTENGRIFAIFWLYIAVYVVDKGLCMLAQILPDGFVRLFAYIFRQTATRRAEGGPLRDRVVVLVW